MTDTKRNQRILIINGTIKINLSKNVDNDNFLDQHPSNKSCFKDSDKDETNLVIEEVCVRNTDILSTASPPNLYEKQETFQDRMLVENINSKFRKIAPKESLDNTSIVNDEKWRLPPKKRVRNKHKNVENTLKPKEVVKKKTRQIVKYKPFKSLMEEDLNMEMEETCEIQAPILEENVLNDSDIETNLLQCPYCSYKLTKDFILKKHIVMHHCDQNLISLKMAISNRKKQGNVLKCPICKEPAKYNSILNHIHTKHSKNVFQTCSICSFVVKKCKVFSEQIRNLRIHVHNSHLTLENFYNCPICSFQTFSDLEMKSHIYHVHKDMKGTIFNCFVCKCITTSLSDLLNHFYLSHPRKDARCSKCNLICRNKYWLHLHEKTHLARNMYKCPYCRYRNNEHFLLKYHINIWHKRIWKLETVFVKSEMKIEPDF